ncbi:TetR family transcriptional regulator [Propionibacteriaceae bacterium Y1685]
MAGRRGPRTGGGSTRTDILAAAEREFAEQGYEGATVRRIAAAAGVDPAMINHHFGSKDELLMAVMELPLDPRPMVEQALSDRSVGPGKSLLRTALAAWETRPGQLTIGLLRSSLQRDHTVAVLRQVLARRVLGPALDALDVPANEREWRAALLASQMVGLIMVRHVIRIEPLASADHDQVVGLIGPTLDRYLMADLDDCC